MCARARGCESSYPLHLSNLTFLDASKHACVRACVRRAPTTGRCCVFPSAAVEKDARRNTSIGVHEREAQDISTATPPPHPKPLPLHQILLLVRPKRFRGRRAARTPAATTDRSIFLLSPTGLPHSHKAPQLCYPNNVPPFITIDRHSTACPTPTPPAVYLLTTAAETWPPPGTTLYCT